MEEDELRSELYMDFLLVGFTVFISPVYNVISSIFPLQDIK